MAIASGDARSVHRSVMPYVAYAVVLASIGGAGVAFWTGQRSEAPVPPRASPPPQAPAAVTAPVVPAPVVPAPVVPAVAAEPAAAPQGLKLPPRPPTPIGQKPAPAAAAVPTAAPSPPAPPSAQSPPATPAPVPMPVPIQAAAPSPAATAEAVPAKSKCTVDGTWPVERTEQGKAIQGMLRDLGLYDGTVYGTVGPTTRAAIRKFQVAAGEPETGEPTEALFASLRKKCAAP